MEDRRRGIFTAIAVILIAGCFIWILSSHGKAGRSKEITNDRVEFLGQEINSISLELGGCSVEVKEGDAFSLEYTDVYKDRLSYEVNNEVLSVKYDVSKHAGLSLFDFGIDNDSDIDSKIVLTVPEGIILENAAMEFGAAEVRMHSVTAEKLVLTVGAGELTAKRLTATGSAEIKVGAGSLTCEESELANASIECGVGELIFGGTVSGDTRVKCGVGEVSMNLTDCAQDDFFGSLKCGLGELSFGDIKISGSGSRNYGDEGGHRFDADCGVGEISVKFR